jgi:integrase
MSQGSATGKADDRCGPSGTGTPRAQAADLLTAAKKCPIMHAYIVVSLLTGARTEELRALTWSHTDLTASHRACSYGDQCEKAVTRRRDCHSAPSNFRTNA